MKPIKQEKVRRLQYSKSKCNNIYGNDIGQCKKKKKKKDFLEGIIGSH